MKIRHGFIFLCVFTFIIILFAVELHYIKLGNASLTTRILFVALFNLNILALLTLMFFVFKSLAKLYIERKQKILGYKFKTKIVIVTVILTSIPAGILFFVSSGLVTSYIDSLLAPQFRQPLLSSLEIAKSVYDSEKERALEFAKHLSNGERSLQRYKITHLKQLPDNPTETVRSAFAGKEGTEVISGDNADTIRAALPEYTNGKLSGIVIVETYMPRTIALSVEKIKEAYETSLQFEAWRIPLKTNYLLILAFFTFIVVFMSLWVALRITRGITDPIQKLAQATNEVASGNLNVNLEFKSADEIGLLIDSFNHMVSEIKTGKEILQHSHMESESRRLWLENILSNINSGVVFLDISGKILTINNSAYSILNLTPEDALGKNYRDVMLKINSDELNLLIKGIIVKDLSGIEKNIKVASAGKNLTLRVFVTTLKDSLSTSIGLLVVFDDITDIINAQQNLTWQEAARRIAHEIKNPLTPIKLSTERMLKKWQQHDKDFDNVFERATQSIIKEVDSLKKLVDDFSTLGKLPEIKKTLIDIRDITNETFALYKGYKGFNIKISIPDNIPPVEADGQQLKRVFINILDNAFHAMGSSGNIEFKIHADAVNNKIFMDISDDGPGISETQKDKIFQPYFSTKESGTGLGLSIASKIITEHKGHIRVKDNIPKGTVFTIDIPIKSYDI
jgi:two-component system nitrogen regulation sensor histidine kinase NtrY